MERLEVFGQEKCHGRHGGFRLPLLRPAPAEVHPEAVVTHQHQEGSVQGAVWAFRFRENPFHDKNNAFFYFR